MAWNSVGKILMASQTLRDRFHRSRLERRCILAADAITSSTTRIFNPGERSAVVIGQRTMLMGESLIVRLGARIKIGDWCFIGPESRIWAQQSIELKDRVLVSHGVHIFDNNSHSLSAQERHARFQELQLDGRHLVEEAVTAKPVLIEDDVWIGFNAAILKGVTVGRGPIVAAGCVVTKDVAPYTIVAGNPARVVGESQP